MSFGVEYVIPSPFDKRVYVELSAAVAKGAFDEGISKLKSFDVESYKKELESKI